MKWGEARLVIQLAVALNAIYLSLRDIRGPEVRREQQMLDASAAMFISAKPVDAAAARHVSEILAQVNTTRVALNTLVLKFEKDDRGVGSFCVGCVLGYVILLVVSAFYYDTTLYTLAAWCLCIAGFLPIGIGFALNILLVRKIRSEVTKETADIDRRLAGLTAAPPSNAPREAGSERV
jgi:hypothetical protein